MYAKGDIIKLKRGIKFNALGDNLQSVENDKTSRYFLVVSNNINNKGKSPILNILSLTSKVKKDYPMHVTISKKDYDFLANDNTVLAEQVLTVNKDKVKTKVGSLNIQDMIKVKNAITTQLLK